MAKSQHYKVKRRKSTHTNADCLSLNLYIAPFSVQHYSMQMDKDTFMRLLTTLGDKTLLNTEFAKNQLI